MVDERRIKAAGFVAVQVGQHRHSRGGDVGSGAASVRRCSHADAAGRRRSQEMDRWHGPDGVLAKETLKGLPMSDKPKAERPAATDAECPICGSRERAKRRRSHCAMTCPPQWWRWVTDERASPTDEIECDY